MAFTLFLVLLEAGILVLFPLFIGHAIDSALDNSAHGVVHLGLLGLALLLVGVGRRMYDSRFYASVYRQVGVSAMVQLKAEPTSVKTARLHMLEELVEFFENSLPELINTLIGLIGVMGILFALNTKVFYGSLVVTLIILLVYWLSGSRTMLYNKGVNNELERQVNVVSQNNTVQLGTHLKKLMAWNIRLSDLEAFNFSISWLFALFFLLVSIIISVNEGIATYGSLFALVMYVFQYIENVLNLPLFYQNGLRLWEILTRLK